MSTPDQRGTFAMPVDPVASTVVFTPACGGGEGQDPVTLYDSATPTEVRLHDIDMSWETVFTRQ
jgi:hypothetical protein